MKKKLLSLLLTATLVMGATVSANAASSEVDITIKATTMDNVSVTVPSVLPIVFNEDGTNTLPSNWTIENVSTISGIHLSQISMDAKDTGWKLLADSEDTKKLSADTKSIKFYAGKDENLKLIVPSTGTESNTGSVTYGAEDISIASGEEQVLTFDVERGAFTQNEASAKAFDMILTFNFN